MLSSSPSKTKQLLQVLKVKAVASEEKNMTAKEYYDLACEREIEYAKRSYELSNNHEQRAIIIASTLNYYAEAVQISPDYYEAYYRRGNFLLTINEQYNNAKIDFEKAIESDVFSNMANEKLNLLKGRANRKWDEAKNNFLGKNDPGLTAAFVEECENYIGMYPESYEANYLLAVSLLNYYLAIHLEGEGGNVYYVHHDIESIKNDYKKIIKHFKKSMLIVPGGARAYYNLGKFFWYFSSEKSLGFLLFNKDGSFIWENSIKYLLTALTKNPSSDVVGGIYAMILNVNLKECSQEEIGYINLLVKEIRKIPYIFNSDMALSFFYFSSKLSELNSQLMPAKFFLKYCLPLIKTKEHGFFFLSEIHRINYQFYLNEYESVSSEIKSEYGLSLLNENCSLLIKLFKQESEYLSKVSDKLMDLCFHVACIYAKSGNLPRSIDLFKKVIDIYDFEPFEFFNKYQYRMLSFSLYRAVYFYYRNDAEDKRVLEFCERILSVLENVDSVPDFQGRDDQPTMNVIVEKVRELLSQRRNVSVEETSVSKEVEANPSSSSEEPTQEVFAEQAAVIESVQVLEVSTPAPEILVSTPEVFNAIQTEEVHKENKSAKKKAEKQRKKEAATQEKIRIKALQAREEELKQDEIAAQARKQAEEDAAQKKEEADKVKRREAAEKECQSVEEIFLGTLDVNKPLGRQRGIVQASLTKAKESDASYGRVEYLFAKLFFYEDFIIFREKSDPRLGECANKMRICLELAVNLTDSFENTIEAYFLWISLERMSSFQDAAKEKYNKLESLGRFSEYSESQLKKFDQIKNMLFPEVRQENIEPKEVEDIVPPKGSLKKINQQLAAYSKRQEKKSPKQAVMNQQEGRKAESTDINLKMNVVKESLGERLLGLKERFKSKLDKGQLNDFVKKVEGLIKLDANFSDAHVSIAESLLHYLVGVSFSKLSKQESISEYDKRDVRNYVPKILELFNFSQHRNDGDIRVYHGLWRLFWNLSIIPSVGAFLEPEVMTMAWEKTIENGLRVLAMDPDTIYLHEIISLFTMGKTDSVRDKDVLLVLEKAIKCRNFINLENSIGVELCQDKVLYFYAILYEKSGTKKALDQHWNAWLSIEGVSSEFQELISKHIQKNRLRFCDDVYKIINSNYKKIKSSFNESERQDYTNYETYYNQLPHESFDQTILKIISIVLKDMLQLLGNIFLRIGNNKKSLDLFEKLIEMHDFLSFDFSTGDQIKKYIAVLRACIVIRYLSSKKDGVLRKYAEKIMAVHELKDFQRLFLDRTMNEQDRFVVGKTIVEVEAFINSNVWCDIASSPSAKSDDMHDIDQSLQDMMRERDMLKLTNSPEESELKNDALVSSNSRVRDDDWKELVEKRIRDLESNPSVSLLRESFELFSSNLSNAKKENDCIAILLEVIKNNNFSLLEPEERAKMLAFYYSWHKFMGQMQVLHREWEDILSGSNDGSSIKKDIYLCLYGKNIEIISRDHRFLQSKLKAKDLVELDVQVDFMKKCQRTFAAMTSQVKADDYALYELSAAVKKVFYMIGYVYSTNVNLNQCPLGCFRAIIDIYNLSECSLRSMFDLRVILSAYYELACSMELLGKVKEKEEFCRHINFMVNPDEDFDLLCLEPSGEEDEKEVKRIIKYAEDFIKLVSAELTETKVGAEVVAQGVLNNNPAALFSGKGAHIHNTSMSTGSSAFNFSGPCTFSLGSSYK